MLFVSLKIELPQKADGFQVLASAKLVWNPFAFLAGVIEIQHRSHGIHAQPVCMKLVQPEHRARQQETSHLSPPVVEDVRLPVRTKSLAGVGVLVKMRAIKVCEPVCV